MCDPATHACERCPSGDEIGCLGSCVRPSVDRLNCGGCNLVCSGATPLCQDGSCTDGCHDGATECGSDCAYLDRDRTHCGQCDVDCGEAADCVAGLCACGAGRLPCGGVCVDLSADRANCGACGNVCNFDELCVGGQCRHYVPAAGCAACPCAVCDNVCCLVSGIAAPVCVEASSCP